MIPTGANDPAGARIPGILPGATTALTLLLALAGQLSAQSTTPPWRAEFDVSFSRTSGNQTMSIYDASIRLRHHRPTFGDFDLQLRGRYGISKVNGESKRAQEFYRSDFRIDFLPGNLGPYVETRIQHDPFKNQKLIVNSGAGARYQIARSDNQGSATLRIAVVHSYEDRTDRGDPTQRARWNMEMEGRQTIASGIEVRHSTKFQPLHDRMSHYMLSLDSRLTIRITNRFSVMMRHEFERDTEPSSRRAVPDDTIITAGISVQL